MNITNYDISNMAGIQALLGDGDSFVRDDFLNNIKEHSHNCFVAEHKGKLAGVSVHTGAEGDGICSFTLYICPQFRRQGLGTALLNQTIESIKGLGIASVIVDFAMDGDTSSFLKNRGFCFKFISHYMVYSGWLLPEAKASFTPYEDKHYSAYYELQSKAFYPLRKANNIKPYLFEQSEEGRKHCCSNAKDYYLIFEQDKLLAAGYAGGEEIDHIAVDDDYRGKGYGRLLVSHGVTSF